MAPTKKEVSVFLVAVFGMVVLSRAQTSEIKYSIKEELAAGTVFGYIVDDSDLRQKVGPDELSNLRFSFLTRGNPNSRFFSIDHKTGVLSVATRIDRETVCSFRHDCLLSVSAVVQSELGPFFHIISVQVEVTDVNDNTPTFSQPNFRITIPENAALGRTFPLPTAFDRDTGSNNTESSTCCFPHVVKDYFLVSTGRRGFFSLRTTRDDSGNMQTALQLVRELNREDTATITVLVGARDGGRPPLTGTLTVRVDVADVNDNYPVFEKYAYNVNVTETTRIVEPLVKVHAHDADEGANGNLSYTFSPLQPQEVLDLFRMEEFTGTVFLAHSLENHTGRIFELVVEASDQGQPPKVSRSLVRVRVLDTVNSRPDIIVDILRSSSDGQSEVSEYAEVGKVVAYVSVTDRDSGENGVTVCRLNTKDFELQPLNNQGQYKVILVTNLDRERIARYQISVACTDFGFPPLESTKTFQVNVRDENDNPPTFSQQTFYTSLQENATAGTPITTLTVTDADLGPNAQVSYKVVGDYRHQFQILENGTLVSTVPLDREVSEKLMVEVVAEDKGYPPLSGSATVWITLEDVNDMAPRFSHKGRYSFSVPENARMGGFVGLVAADDEDLGVNAQVTFWPGMRRTGNLPFEITRDGVVKTSRALDREKKDIYYFPVVAKDGGSPPLSSTTTLTIHVDDVNDNTPYFVYPTEINDSLSIPHTFPPRTSITQIRATDRDAGQNAALIYSAASANDSSGIFGMDPTTGDLYLHRHLSSRQVGLYVLRVAAHDEGTPQLSNQTLLFLDVYFDNSTVLDLAKAAAPSRAMVTVLVVVGVVLVLAVVVVSALICIRRQEARRKKAAGTSGGGQQPSPPKLQGGYYIAPGVCESPAFGGNGGGLNKPVPEQSLDGSGFGSLGRGGVGLGTDVSSLRTTNPYVIMPPHSNFTDPDGPPEIIEISRNGMFHRTEDPCPDEENEPTDNSRFSTFRSLEGVLNSSFRQNSLQRNSVDTMDEEKRADDTLSLSELSYQSTSDSGRGGSEFDVNNAGQKEKVAKLPATSSPLSTKGPNNNNPSFRSRDPELSFTTFRGESPCSFRFDSDSDTLKRHQRGSVSGTTTNNNNTNPSMARASPLPLTPKFPPFQSHHTFSLHYYDGGDHHHHPHPHHPPSSSSDEGRRSCLSALRRSITPGADNARYGFLPSLGLGSSSSSSSIPRHESQGGSHYGTGPDHPASRTGRIYTGSTFITAPPSTHIEFRSRNNLGMSAAVGRGATDYVNAYSDLDSGDDTHQGSELEATENDYLLPQYPTLLEEREEEEGREAEVSERSALNFVPGLSTTTTTTTNTSRSSEDSYRNRRSSEL
ncbi:protocadherin-1-like [Babylonia areolata]|uniref:protocadherin-1-like n=1 Tax=Babylonia areolata TaxID=304850 RepID=UPI003FD04EB6